jgi:hypothetical protein
MNQNSDSVCKVNLLLEATARRIDQFFLEFQKFFEEKELKTTK